MSKNQSRFASALEGLLDETNFFTRAEWANALNVKKSEIEDWVSDRTFPSALSLRLIFSILHGNRGSEPFKSKLEDFRNLFELPWREITPLPAPMPTFVWDYENTGYGLRDVMIDSTLAGFLKRLRRAPFDVQQDVIQAALQKLTGHENPA